MICTAECQRFKKQRSLEKLSSLKITFAVKIPHLGRRDAEALFEGGGKIGSAGIAAALADLLNGDGAAAAQQLVGVEETLFREVLREGTANLLIEQFAEVLRRDVNAYTAPRVQYDRRRWCTGSARMVHPFR